MLHLRAAGKEPETLRIHREMYQRRLREMERLNKPSTEVDAANSPAVLDHRDPKPQTEESKRDTEPQPRKR